MRVSCQRGRGEIKEPGTDDASPAPDLSDIGDVEIETLLLRECFAVGILEDVQAFGEGLHQAVLDAIVHHFDEVPGAIWPGVNVAPLGACIAAIALGRSRYIAKTG